MRRAFSGIGREIMNSVREGVYASMDEAAFEKIIIGIENTTAALKEAEVEDEKIIFLLQKYWDLRPSEAREFLHQEKYTEDE